MFISDRNQIEYNYNKNSNVGRKFFMKSKIVAYIERDVDSGAYVAIVPGIPGAHTQAETLDELRIKLKEVIELCLEDMDPDERDSLPEFVGVQQIDVAV
jgi:predicted RNase H-like HicB family nuclease